MKKQTKNLTFSFGSPKATLLLSGLQFLMYSDVKIISIHFQSLKVTFLEY